MAFDLNKSGGGKQPDLSKSKARAGSTADSATAAAAETQGRSGLLPIAGAVVLIAVAGWYFFVRPDSRSAEDAPASQAAVQGDAAKSANQPSSAPRPVATENSPSQPAPSTTAPANTPLPAGGGATPPSRPAAGAPGKPTSTAASSITPSGGATSPVAPVGVSSSSPAGARPVSSAVGAGKPDSGRSTATSRGERGSDATTGTMVPVRFEAGSSSVTTPDEAVVESILTYLSTHPTAKATVTGYASSEGDLATNLALASKRADAFKAYLVGKGAMPVRIVTVGGGIEKPIASNETQSGRARNRRVEVTF